jgi:hypothetical protein
VLITSSVLITELAITSVLVVPVVVVLLDDFGDRHPISTTEARSMIGMILRMVYYKLPFQGLKKQTANFNQAYFGIMPQSR